MTVAVLVNCRSGVIQRFETRRAGGRMEHTNIARFNPGADLDPADIELFRTTPSAFQLQPDPAPVVA